MFERIKIGRAFPAPSQRAEAASAITLEPWPPLVDFLKAKREPIETATANEQLAAFVGLDVVWDKKPRG